MAVCKCTGEHVDSPQDSQLMELLGDYRGYDGGLIPVLQGAQEIYGYLPSEVLETISQELTVPFSEVYGVVTFYAQFHLKLMCQHFSGHKTTQLLASSQRPAELHIR